MGKKILVTETVLRDAHQSLIATRMSINDMLPILEKLDAAGFHSLECWGGATFDACLRFLNEDPWDRLRTIRKKCPNTKLQMLFRGQNMLGYRHYGTIKFDDEAYKRLTALTIHNNHKCSQCWAKWNCGAGCPNQRRVYTPEIFDATCMHYRNMLKYDLLLELSKQYYQKTHKDMFTDIREKLKA